MENPAAIDGKNLAGDTRRCLAGKEHDRFRRLGLGDIPAQGACARINRAVNIRRHLRRQVPALARGR